MSAKDIGEDGEGIYWYEKAEKLRIELSKLQAEQRTPEGYVLLSVADFNEYQRMKAVKP